MSGTILVTGALGNAGWKLTSHLARQSHADRVVGVDVVPPTPDHLGSLEQCARERSGPGPAVELRQADLTDWDDPRWREPAAQARAVVHLAAQNPRPEATWSDAVASLDMTANLLAAAADNERLRRLVFVSSSHVMGGYLKETLGPGQLGTDFEPRVGTVWRAGSRPMNATAYAVPKLAGERMCRTLARRSAGRCTAVSLRIGWVQVGENVPETLSVAGTPSMEPVRGAEADPEVARAAQWFRELWLSNRDYTRLMDRALEADGTGWPDGFVVVNAMSRNPGLRWSLEEARRWLQWEPKDGIVDPR
ncbi:MAG: NAD(P)-dependent oxidoreductase [Acidobacteria bacterium]|jgi:nucleoside-diphosphate-sugar epimerase|nr:NAD(P)-dependent oxidoreductase [Acidobacteriota bacterium]